MSETTYDTSANKPLKGAHLVLNGEMVAWLKGTFDIIDAVYAKEVQFDDEGDEMINGVTVLKALEAEGWTREDDKFGKKCYATTPHPAGGGHHGECRVTVVVKKNGELNLDVRLWGEY